MMATDALNQLTGMPSLPISRGLMSKPTETPKGYISSEELAPAKAEMRGAIGAAEQRVGEADVAIKEAERQEKAREAEARGNLLREYKADLEQMPERAQLKEMRQKLEGMEFVPTRDTLEDVAGLFSLIGVIGMVVGKGNAMNAMSAMNGMLEGHQKGRRDLFKQEQAIFDKNFKAMQAKVQQSLAEFQEALELKKIDKEAGEQAMQVALAKSESPLLKAMKAKQGDVAVLNALKGAEKDLDTFVSRQDTLRKASDEREDRKRRLEMDESLRKAQMAQTRELALMRIGAKDTKVPKEEGQRNDARNVIIPKLEKALPVLDRIHKEGNWNTMTTLLAVDPRAAELQFKNDPEALELIRTFAYFRSTEFEKAGKALTRKEDQILAPIVRSDLRAYEAVKGAITDGLDTMKKEQKGIEARYPSLKAYNDVLRGDVEEPSVPGTAVQAFNSVEEAEAANLPSGTKITINGRPATVE